MFLKKVLNVLFMMAISVIFFSCKPSCEDEVFEENEEEVVEVLLTEDGFRYAIVNDSVSIYGFDENTLIKLIIPEEIEGLPVTRIANYAFAGSMNIVEVVLPSTIKEIGEGAFYKCERLQKINFPNGLERIERHAFYFAKNLTAVVLPASIIHYDADIFYECYNLVDVKLEEGSTIFPSLNGTGVENVNIPSSVKIIMSYAFPKGIKEVILPEGVERLESYAFGGCENITSIKLPSTIKFIGSRCFSEVPITSLELPNGIEELENACFYGSKIEELYIPQSVKKIGNINCIWRDEDGCDRYTLKKVTFACDLPKEVTRNYIILESSANYCFDFDEEWYKEYTYASDIHNSKQRIEIVFEDTVKTIEADEIDPENFHCVFKGAFNSIDFGNGVEKIGNGAFDVNVANLVLPSSLKSMDDNNFFGQIKKLTIQSDFDNSFFEKWRGEVGGEIKYVSPFYWGYEVDPDTGLYVTEMNEWGFLDTIEAPIELINFTENVTSIPPRLFESSWIDTVTASNLESIGEYAFFDSKINTISFPHLKLIGKNAFQYCQIDTSFAVTADEIDVYAFYGAKLPADADLSKTNKFGFRSFTETIFEGEVVINANAEFLSVDEWGDERFLKDTFWKSKMPSLVVNCNLFLEPDIFREITTNSLIFGSEVTCIGESSFTNSSINGIVDLTNVTYIGKWAFDGADVEKFVFGSNPTTVKYRAFRDCTDAEFEFNGCVNLDMDSNEAFANCQNLKELPSFKPNTEITDGVFVNCTSLQELDLTNVYAFSRAFVGCVNVERIVGLDSPVMEFDEEKGVIYMNNEHDQKCYLVVGFDKLIPEDLQLPNKVSVIAGNAFMNCKNLKKISIEGVREEEYVVYRDIQYEAFLNCENLESFSFGVCSAIGDSTFKGCSSLKEAVIRSYNVGDNAFANCTSLEKVTFTCEELEKAYFGQDMFSECISLKEIHDYRTLKGVSLYGSQYCWRGCDSVEHYYAYYGFKDNGWYILLRDIKSACQAFYVQDAFSDILEYVELSEEEGLNLNFNDM